MIYCLGCLTCTIVTVEDQLTQLWSSNAARIEETLWARLDAHTSNVVIVMVDALVQKLPTLPPTPPP